jgi:hypothetical protein
VIGDTVHLVDVTTGSAASLTPQDGGWSVREGGPARLWDRIEHVLDADVVSLGPHLGDDLLQVDRVPQDHDVEHQSQRYLELSRVLPCQWPERVAGMSGM